MLRKLVLAVTFVITAIFSGCNAAVATSGPYAEARDAVYMVTGGNGNGSAVVIEPGLLLTAAHVAAVPNLYLEPGHRKVRVLRVDEVNDIALLGADVACPCAELAVGAPVQDEDVLVVGFPMQQVVGLQVLTRGVVQGVKGNRMQLTAQATFGSSGGGAFVRRAGHWRLVGILVDMVGQPGKSSFGPVGVPVNYLSRAVDPKTMRDFLYERRSAAHKP